MEDIDFRQLSSYNPMLFWSLNLTIKSQPQHRTFYFMPACTPDLTKKAMEQLRDVSKVLQIEMVSLEDQIETLTTYASK